MPVWQKVVVYAAFLLAGAVITLLIMGKNVRSQAYVGDQSLAGLSQEQARALVSQNPGAVSIRTSLVVSGTNPLSVPAPLALPLFLAPVPLLALYSAHRLLKRQLSPMRIAVYLAAAFFATVFILYLFLRA